MKVLHYIPTLEKNSGGVGTYMQILAQELGKLCELHIVTHHHEDELEVENSIVHYIPIDYKYKPWKYGKLEFLNFLNSIKPDLFHTNGCWVPMSAMSAAWARESGYPVVYTPHGMLEPYAIHRHYWTKKLPAILLFQKRGIKAANLVHATAETERDNLMKLGWNKNISIVPNCVQTDNITLKDSWERKKNILFLSRVHPKKGVNFLIEAVSQLKDELAGYKVRVAGPGEEAYVGSLKQLAIEKGVAEMFDFVGPVFSDDKWDLYKQADLFVLPTYSENFGIVVPEALASGTPVITTVGTPWEELNTEHCGWCVNVGTEPLKQALIEFLNIGAEELELMGKNGRKLVIEKYDLIQVASMMYKLYQRLNNVLIKDK